MDENHIMMAVVGGDTGKFGILYERYKKPMYGYFFRLTSGDMHISEDLSHQVFVKALKYKHSFKGTGTFAKWLFSIAHNLGIDYLRKSNRYRSEEYNAETSIEDAYEMDDIERQENLSLLNSALNSLSDDDREILLLAKIKELKYSEIAELTGYSETAIKTRVFRALQRLTKIFKEIQISDYERSRKKTEV